jgi:site-specific recombinase XerD
VFQNHVQSKIGKKRLDEVTKDDIARLLHERKASGAAAGSANRIVILCRYMFNLALKWETPGVTKNPASGVQMFDDPPTKERYLSTQEAQRLYESVCLSDNEVLRFIIPMLIELPRVRRRLVG